MKTSYLNLVVLLVTLATMLQYSDSVFGDGVSDLISLKFKGGGYRSYRSYSGYKKPAYTPTRRYTPPKTYRGGSVTRRTTVVHYRRTSHAYHPSTYYYSYYSYHHYGYYGYYYYNPHYHVTYYHSYGPGGLAGTIILFAVLPTTILVILICCYCAYGCAGVAACCCNECDTYESEGSVVEVHTTTVTTVVDDNGPPP
jgi:hypothetical protein